MDADRVQGPAWLRPGWDREADAWILAALERLGSEATGPVEHVRDFPWGAIRRVPTTDGVVWFKEGPPALAFEPALTMLVARRRPDFVPTVLAADDARMLTADAGRPLREVLEQGADGPDWHGIVRELAELQIEAAADAEELLAVGAPDRRPERLAAAAAELIDRSSDALFGFLPLLPRIEGLVEELGDAVPLSVSHEEVQEQNVVVSDGRPVLLDWAEVSVSHPFAGLLMTLRRAVEAPGVEPGGREVLALRDAYLEPWTRFAPPAELRRVFDAAYLLGMVSRALTWQAIYGDGGPAEDGFEYDSPRAWFALLTSALTDGIRLGGP